MDARRFVRDGAGAACVPNGMWIFTRQQARDEGLVAKARGIAVAKGIGVSVLEYVNQTACPAEHMKPPHSKLLRTRVAAVTKLFGSAADQGHGNGKRENGTRHYSKG
eukprot:scaffold61806_cov67-Phaeocystis_antarctica.AAC.2